VVFSYAQEQLSLHFTFISFTTLKRNSYSNKQH